MLTFCFLYFPVVFTETFSCFCYFLLSKRYLINHISTILYLCQYFFELFIVKLNILFF